VSPRRIFLVLGVLAVLGLVLWLAWTLDPRTLDKKTDSKSQEEFSYKLQPGPTTINVDVLLSCNEEEVRKPTTKFAEWLKLKGLPLYLPGGPLALARLDGVRLAEEFKPAQRGVIEILKRHNPRRVVLITHTMCIYYDTVAAWQDSLPQVLERQKEDMNAAIHLLRGALPQTKIEGYVAKKESDVITFHKLP
jgi:hypothetical protein